MAQLPLVEMGAAPPIVPGCDMLQPVIRFCHRHVYSDNCSCLIEQHSRIMAVIRLSCASLASLRHTCAIIMLSNQHLDMPHLLGGMDYLGKGEALTNRFERNDSFVYVENVLDL